MYIMDGIVYAGEPTESLEVTKVKPLDDMIMLVTFSNGETKLFDATILTGQVYEPLKDDKIFKNPVIEYGVVTWNDGDIDCSPEYMYKNSYEYPEVASFQDAGKYKNKSSLENIQRAYFNTKQVFDNLDDANVLAYNSNRIK